MIAWILALALQEPKTIEDRLKELEAQLAGLEERSKRLADENEKLEKRLADAKAAREDMARQAASAWVKRWAKDAQWSEKQAAEIEALWAAWTKDDFQKPADAAAWKSREETLRAKLTAEQVARLSRKVREGQENYVKALLRAAARSAQVPPESVPALEKAAQARVRVAETALLAGAHPGQLGWAPAVKALEDSLDDFSAVLAPEQAGALRQAIEGWKPQR
jgi:hypothetical protein